MLFKKSVWLDVARLILLLFGLLAACSPQSVSPTPTSPPATLLLYRTPTQTSPAPSAVPDLQATSPPLPTPTPLLYTVLENDTLIGIAYRFGLSLEDLLAANPGVDPRFLSIGTVLVIPGGEGQGIAALPTPTPVPVEASPPRCYPTAAGGLWCFWLVENRREQGLENLSALVTLFSSSGDQVASQTVLLPLNLLPSGQRAPLVAFFQPPAPEWYAVEARLLTALVVSPGSDRYLAAALEDLEVEVAASGLEARVTGQVGLAEDSPEARLVWVAAVAFDVAGNVVGVRRWESQEGLAPPDSLPFDLQVFSLGPPIDTVEVLVEARP